MSLFNATQLRNRAAREATYGAPIRKSLDETVRRQAQQIATYDIFISHAFADADLIFGLHGELRALGFSSYIDWIEDPTLDRSRVTAATAATLRARMGQCRSLLFATSDAAAESRWMPWELGYFDAFLGTVGVLPIAAGAQAADDFSGREYLGLYPYITRDPTQGTSRETLWVHEDRDTYVDFASWLNGSKPTRQR